VGGRKEMKTMTLPLSDPEVAARVLKHIESGTTDAGAEVWREPVENYRTQSRLEAEIKVLRRFPAAFCPSAALTENGAYVAREAAGVPIIAVRGQDGKVRAFRNACRHRGMRLADGQGCTNAFMCRYHGWTYGLDGALRHVPHEAGFPGLDKSTHGLVPVKAEERAGLVFVTQDGEANPLDALPDLIAKDQMLYATSEREIDANWKIFLEGFLEGYHIRATHPETFLPYGFDNLTLLETFGRNSRITFPFKRIKKLTDVPPQQRSVMGLVTYVYHLFPNALVTILSSHTNLVILEPISLEKTRFVSYSLTNAGHSEEALAAAKRDAEFVGNTGAAEDRAVVAAIQKGMAANANTHFTFGHYESLIIHFHKQLGVALAA
jgi:phenylpropionate dioxygenase-like ring-hydroxylating dioxygenase large terminal subunit